MSDSGSERVIDLVYRDPVDEIWLATARRLGLRVERSDEVYASYDGRGTLRVSTPRHLDADDSLAQLVFHEICHALVAGPDALAHEDWKLSNTDRRDLVMEHACHRVQAALSDRHGLRRLMAVTTEHRAYWDALPEDPLADTSDPAAALARQAFARAQQPPYAEPLRDALERTAQIARAVGPLASADSLWSAV